MARISIVESVGGSIQNVANYRDLENHHPSQALQERGRVYARVGGESEEILGDYAGTAVLTPGGNYMVSKDMVLKSPGLDNSQVPIPSPAAGVIGKIDRADGIITINDPNTGDTMFQIRHAKIDPNLKPGDRVEYGQPLGLQHGYNNGNPQAFGDHVHFDVNTKYIAQADKWIKDMHNGTITTDRRPGPTENIVTERPTFVPISGNFPKPADPPLADGKLSLGEKGPEVEKLQKALVAAGARDAEGKALNPDGDFGGRTKQAVENYQRANNQPVTGVADTKMLTDLGVIAPQQAQPQPNTPQPQPNTPQPKPNDPAEAKPNAPTTNTPQPTAPEKLSGTYQEGDSGEGVRKLQERLNERMGLNIATDGKYGPLTEASVLLYQHQNGLKTDGIVGPNTLAKLNEPVQQAAVSNSPPSMTETPQAQTTNAQTTNATPNAQTASTNTVTPAVEPTKPNPAQTEPVKPSAQDGFSIKPGDTGPAVVELQKVMQTHGSMCSCGTHGLTTDGKYGPITEQAVKTYQLLNDIAPANGVANEETLKKLGLDPKQLQAMQAQPNKDVSAVPNDKALMTHPDNAANPRFNEVMKVFDTLPAGTFKSDQEKTTKAVEAAAESLIGERKLDKVESAKLVNGTIYLGDKPNISDQTTNLSFVSLASNKSIEESSKAVNAVNAAQEKPAEVKGDQKAPDKVPDPTLVNPAIESRPKVYMA